mgnify:CR=1 FL=1
MKYIIKTYGCQMNVHESEKLAGILVEMGYVLAENIADADVIVFNTCCIRENAEQKVRLLVDADDGTVTDAPFNRYGDEN